jgi:hypothetical protein
MLKYKNNEATKNTPKDLQETPRRKWNTDNEYLM